MDWFWAIIAFSAKVTDGDPNEHQKIQAQRFLATLEALPDQDLVDAVYLYESTYNAMYCERLWAAAYVIGGGCSDDGFMDFRHWLISRGRRIAEAAMVDPDSLADLCLEECEASFELFGYVPSEAFKARADGVDHGLSGEPTQEGQRRHDLWFDFDNINELRQRLPRLTAQFI